MKSAQPAGVNKLPRIDGAECNSLGRPLLTSRRPYTAPSRDHADPITSGDVEEFTSSPEKGRHCSSNSKRRIAAIRDSSSVSVALVASTCSHSGYVPTANFSMLEVLARYGRQVMVN